MKIPRDKLLHFLTGIPLGLAVALLSHHWWPALVAGAIVGMLKEGFDWWENGEAAKCGLPPPHCVELLDAVATMAGASFGGLVHFLR